jgi:hypothetical protein
VSSQYIRQIHNNNNHHQHTNIQIPECLSDYGRHKKQALAGAAIAGKQDPDFPKHRSSGAMNKRCKKISMKKA